MPALPYIARLIVLRRLIWPSAWPLLQGNSMALRTAPMSRCKTRANRTIGGEPGADGIVDPNVELARFTAPENTAKSQRKAAHQGKLR